MMIEKHQEYLIKEFSIDTTDWDLTDINDVISALTGIKTIKESKDYDGLGECE